jgi:hypothetical protein
LGVRLFQGYLFAKPGVEALPTIADDILAAVHQAHDAELLARSRNGPQDSIRTAGA